MGSEDVGSNRTSNTIGRRLHGAEALKAHATLGVGLAFCVVAFWFEFKRATSGNALSWAYVFEWPLLAAFAIYMWWHVLHPGREKAPRKKEGAVAPEFEGMLAAWQEHQLDAHRVDESRDVRRYP